MRPLPNHTLSWPSKTSLTTRYCKRCTRVFKCYFILTAKCGWTSGTSALPIDLSPLLLSWLLATRTGVEASPISLVGVISTSIESESVSGLRSSSELTSALWECGVCVWCVVCGCVGVCGWVCVCVCVCGCVRGVYLEGVRKFTSWIWKYRAFPPVYCYFYKRGMRGNANIIIDTHAIQQMHILQHSIQYMCCILSESHLG